MNTNLAENYIVRLFRKQKVFSEVKTGTKFFTFDINMRNAVKALMSILESSGKTKIDFLKLVNRALKEYD